MPERIQLRRSRGWRLPPNAVSVARPGVFGNPFTVAAAKEAGYTGRERYDGTRATPEEGDARLAEWCVALFRRWLTVPHQTEYVGPVADARKAKLLARLPELRGKDLACWCPAGAVCHADILLEIANRPGG